MGILAAFVVFATLQSAPPADLEAAAVSLRKSGGNVIVGRAEFGEGWEIWLDFDKPVRDETLAPIQGISKLGAIRIMGGGFSDRGIAHLKNLPDLHLLVLISDRLTDKCLEPISRLTSLVKLDLNKAKLTKVGLEKLRGLPKLERLYLYNAQFSDSDASRLKVLKGLKVLDLPPNLSAATLSSLREALPNTRVEQRK